MHFLDARGAMHVAEATVVDVGSTGFANGQTVTLSLSYAWATNISDGARLLDVRELGTDTVQALPSSVDTDAKLVTTIIHRLRVSILYDPGSW